MRALFLLLLICVACSGSTSPDASTDAGTDAVSDSSTDAAPDAPTDAPADATDGATDAPLVDAGECPINCIRTVLYWRWDGGLAATRNRYEVSECARVVRTTEDLLSGGSTLCIEHVDQSACELVDPVERALRDSDVEAARAAAPILYGVDSRPADGAVFVIDFGDAVIEVGGECMGSAGCTEIPAGVGALRDALMAMQTHVDGSSGCETALEDPETFECRVGLGDGETQCLVGDEYCFEPFRCAPTPESCVGPATCECVGEGFPCTEEDGAVTVMWTE